MPKTSINTHMPLINDTQRLISAKSSFGYSIPVYDDGYGKLFIHRGSMGISGIVRARTWEDAYGICEDEFFLEASETWEEMVEEYSTIYLSGRELWEYKKKASPLDVWQWEDLNDSGREAWFGRGQDVPYLGELTEHPCWCESYGFRPSGPNARDKVKHGIYAKDLNGDWLDELTETLVEELEITLEIQDEET